jgi:hypothetical protein
MGEQGGTQEPFLAAKRAGDFREGHFFFLPGTGAEKQDEHGGIGFSFPKGRNSAAAVISPAISFFLAAAFLIFKPS